jgi:catechol-2,3-dioxygenase
MQSSAASSVKVGVDRIGHVGLYARDLEGLRDFYRDVLGLQVADQDLDFGIVFLSSRPDEEHHELALARGRSTDNETPMVQQVAWQVDSVEQLRAFHRLFKERNVQIQYEVTHGNALSIYFFDPEGNRNEVYYKTGVKAPQPFRKMIDLELPAEQILEENLKLVAEGRAVQASSGS